MDEEKTRDQVAAENAAEDSHLQPGRRYADPARRAGQLLVVGDEDPYAFADARQSARRVVRLTDAVQTALRERVTDPSGPDVMRVGFREWQKMLVDSPDEVQTFAQYGPALLYYCDAAGNVDMSRPRSAPLRPLLRNEMGTWRGKIVCVKDAGPDDIGEGTYVPVGVDLEAPTEPAPPPAPEPDDA